MGKQTFLGKFMGGLFYIGSNDQIQGGRKSFANAFPSNLNSVNFFFYQIISTYYKHQQHTKWKWKYNKKYKHTTTTEPYAH